MTQEINSQEKENKIVEQENLKLAILNAQLCEDKLAEDVFLLDLRNVDSAPADFFVLCSCDSINQVLAIADNNLRTIRDYGLQRPKIEGTEIGEWVLMDYFDLIVHIMHKETRDFYKIEKLWGDATFYKVDGDANLQEVDYQDVLSIYN